MKFKFKFHNNIGLFLKSLLIWFAIVVVVIMVGTGIAGRYFEILRESSEDMAKQKKFASKETEKQSLTSITTLSETSYKITTTPPGVSAKAYLVYDLENDKKIYGRNEDMLLPPASVTKIMTAVIAMENYDLSKPVLIPERCVGINASNVGFKANEMFTLEDLLYGLLVRSGADAACAIANIYNDEAGYVDLMNKKAKEIGMVHTKYQNEVGFDASTEQQTTVSDLEKLTKYALKFSGFRKIVGTKTVDLISLNTKNIYSLLNTNDLLFSIPGTAGIKTGTTEEAKQCLAYLYENRGKEVLIIILGSDDRFKDTSELLEWSINEIDNATENKPLSPKY